MVYLRLGGRPVAEAAVDRVLGGDQDAGGLAPFARRAQIGLEHAA